MSGAEQTSLADRRPSRLGLLPVIYAIVAILSLIATASYAAGVAFFLDAGNGRAAAVTSLAASATLAVTIASASAAYGLSRRDGWSWYVAAAVGLVWTANGLRVVVVDGLTLPSSLVIGLVMLWLLWTEREALEVDPVGRIRAIRR